MDKRLERLVDQLDTIEDPSRELSFAMLASSAFIPETLDWLAVCAIERAAELRGERGDG